MRNVAKVGLSGWVLALGVALAALASVEPADAANKAREPRPIPLGVSGGNINHFEGGFCYGGTLGALVKDSSNTQYILSNNHILARTNAASAGEDIVQPGLIDVGCQKITDDAVADFSKAEPLRFRHGGSRPGNSVDAAIAQVRSGAVRTSGEIKGIGLLSGQVATDKIGCDVKKSGRTTGVTTSTITSVDVTIDVDYGKGRIARFVDQFLVGGGSFSSGGDSGSLIVHYDKANSSRSPRAVGLLFAGSSSYTVGNPISRVQSALGVSIVGTGPGDAGDCNAATSTSQVETGRDAKNKHQDELLTNPHAIGAGVGQDGAVEVYLEDDSDEAKRNVPDQVDGVKVRPVVTGKITAL
jgi:hypothetical protein